MAARPPNNKEIPELQVDIYCKKRLILRHSLQGFNDLLKHFNRQIGDFHVISSIILNLKNRFNQ
jgi:hypothetical protein